MASEGPLSAGSGANDASVGTLAWVNPTNIVSSNDVRATCTDGGLGSTTNYLVSSSHGFAIPTGATIDGIIVEIERHRIVNTITDNRVRIVKGGTIGATEKSAGAAWVDTTDTVASFGASNDLWGETWTVGDINASNFGVALSASLLAGARARVDHVRITVYYTPLPAQPPQFCATSRIVNQLIGR